MNKFHYKKRTRENCAAVRDAIAHKRKVKEQRHIDMMSQDDVDRIKADLDCFWNVREGDDTTENAFGGGKQARKHNKLNRWLFIQAKNALFNGESFGRKLTRAQKIMFAESEEMWDRQGIGDDYDPLLDDGGNDITKEHRVRLITRAWKKLWIGIDALKPLRGINEYKAKTKKVARIRMERWGAAWLNIKALNEKWGDVAIRKHTLEMVLNVKGHYELAVTKMAKLLQCSRAYLIQSIAKHTNFDAFAVAEIKPTATNWARRFFFYPI